MKCVGTIPGDYERLMDIVLQGPQNAGHAAVVFQLFPSEVERRVLEALQNDPAKLPKKPVDPDAPLVYRIGHAKDEEGGGSTVVLEVAYRPAPEKATPTLHSVRR